MDLTGVNAEGDDAAEASHSPSALPEDAESNSESPHLSSLPPYFRSYEAYLEHLEAKYGPEGVPEDALDRLCANCAAVLKKISELRQKIVEEVPFCSVTEFLQSAAEGSCHVCRWFMGIAQRSNNSMASLKDVLSKASSANTPGNGGAASILFVDIKISHLHSAYFFELGMGANEEGRRIQLNLYLQEKSERNVGCYGSGKLYPRLY